MLRRVVCATSLTRPTSRAAEAIISVAREVIQDMVRTKAWPATWIGP
jgi:LysR family nitrogen assimilation transcriptional regulator